jgi:O-antigen/teichoic acid export membrane protein
VLKNFLILGSGEMIGRGIHALAFLAIARALGSQSLGELSLAMAVSSYVLLAVQQGIDPIAIRQVSRHPSLAAPLTCRIFGLRLALSLAAAALIAGGYVFQVYPAGTGLLLLVLAITYPANALTPRWPFLALEDSRPPALASLIAQCCFAASAVWVWFRPSAWVAAAGQSLGEVAAAVFLWRTLSYRIGALRPIRDGAVWLDLLRESWPVTASLVLGNLLSNFDLLALAFLGKSSEIGVYAASARFITLFSPLLGALQLTVLPGFSKTAGGAELFREASRLAWTTAAALAPAAVLLFFLSGQILFWTVGPAYSSGSPMLKILAWVLPAWGARAVFRQAMYSLGLQRLDTILLGAGVGLNVALDLILIPTYGAIGCAISTLCAETGLCASGAVAVRIRTREERARTLRR